MIVPGRAVARLGADRGGRGADHRLPVRHGPRGADSGDGGQRPRRGRRRADQGRRTARAAGRRRHRRLRQDRHADRRPAAGRRCRCLRRRSTRRDRSAWSPRSKRRSEHPLAKADRRACGPRASRPLTRSSDFRRGRRARASSATVDGHHVIVGTQALLARIAASTRRALDATAATWTAQARTVVFAAIDGKAAAAFAIADTLRPECAPTVVRR